MSRRNLERAQEYRPEVLDNRRAEFYRFLRQANELWQAAETAEKTKSAIA